MQSESVDSACDVYFWPSTIYNNFQELIENAITKNIAIKIKEDTHIKLDTTILIKNNSSKLKISGECNNNSNRPIITSSGHSIFQVGGRHTFLIIENIILNHVCYQKNQNDIGAVIFGLNLSNIQCNNCLLTSNHGFGIWAVQRSIIEINSCHIISTNRSGCVCFGKSNLLIKTSTISDCEVHNVCIRGTATIKLIHCKLLNANKRSLYGYQQSKVIIEDCLIEGTKCNDFAAIEMLCTKNSYQNNTSIHFKSANKNMSVDEDNVNENEYYIQLKNVQIINNAGVGLKITNETDQINNIYLIENCCIENNKINQIISNHVQVNENIVSEKGKDTLHAAVKQLGDGNHSLSRLGLVDAKGFAVWEFEVDTSVHIGQKKQWQQYEGQVCAMLEAAYERWVLTKQMKQDRDGDDKQQPIKQQEEEAEEEAGGGAACLEIVHHHRGYSINLEMMQQTNQQSFYTRNIRRVPAQPIR